MSRATRISRASWVACVVLVLGAGATAAAEPATELPTAGLPSQLESWKRLDTEHFTILSSTTSGRTFRIARQIEGLYSAIAELTHLEPISPVPTLIYVFSDDASLRPYKHLYRGQPASMSGAVYSQPYGDFIAMNGGRRIEASVTVFHEYLHVVLRNNLPGIPLWLEEGLAELFSTFQLKDGQGLVGKPLPWHADALSRGERTPLRHILAADVTSELYNRFEHQGEFYARSWELVHYLLIGRPERRLQALRYLGQVFAGTPRDQAFTRAFAMTPEELDTELADYRKDGYPSRRLRLGKTEDRTPVLHPLAYPEVLRHLGELLVSQGDRAGDAAFHFEQALVRRPDFGRAVAGLGLLAQQDGDMPRARALYQRAAKMSEDARSSYLYGTSLLVLGRAVSDAKIAEARRHLERSVKLEPGFAPVWVSLALARHLEAPRGAQDAPPEAAVLPVDPEAALKVMLLHSRSRQREAAHRLWNGFFENRPDGPERRAARRILERLDWLATGGEPPHDLVHGLEPLATGQGDQDDKGDSGEKTGPKAVDPE